MDADQDARKEEKSRLLSRLSEIMDEEQRQQGTFNRVPHFSTLEEARAAEDQAGQCRGRSRAS